MITNILIGVIALLAGYWFGKEQQQSLDFKKDPDNDPKLSDDDSTILLFTKQERYELGRAMAIGSKTDVKRAKEKLQLAVGHFTGIACENKMEDLKKEAKYRVADRQKKP